MAQPGEEPVANTADDVFSAAGLEISRSGNLRSFRIKQWITAWAGGLAR